MITNLSSSNSLVSGWVRELRDVGIQGDRMRFRRNMERIGEVAAYEISKLLPYKQVTVQTPLGMCDCMVPDGQPVLATILRAGLPLHQGLLNYFDGADCAFIGAYRKHAVDGSFEICQQYVANPVLEGRPLILADPMLATGASLVLALQTLMENERASQVHVVAAIGCAAGVAAVQSSFPGVHIWVGAIDEGLTDEQYIYPGLGDAGDLAYGEKRQR